MQVTQFSDYALRVLMHLALRPQERSTIDEIAQRYRVSRAHLVKVAQRLASAGFVEATRGRHGGLRLGRPAGEIRLGDVFRATEENLALVECFAADGDCVIAPACRLRGVLGEALAAFLAVLDRRTLADLVERGQPLARLLRLPPLRARADGSARARPPSAERSTRPGVGGDVASRAARVAAGEEKP
jgi:Rrf2 family nitric oxide-sensitive transcriptional repressor